MFSDKLIKRILRQIAKEGERYVFIYPFGVNGVLIADCIERYFESISYISIDNVYSEYNSKIKDINWLKSNYNGQIVILSSEDEKLNKSQIDELSFVPNNRVVNLRLESAEEEYNTTYYTIVGNIENRLYVDNFLPEQDERKEDCTDGKIKVRIVHRQLNTWNALSSIYRAFCEDTVYDVKLVIMDDESVSKQMQRLGCCYIMEQDYDIRNDKPDILILVTPTWKPITNCRKYAKQIVVASSLLWHYSGSRKELEQNLKRYVSWEPDYYIFDPFPFEKMKAVLGNSAECYEMTNAKFDGIYNALHNKIVEGNLKKLQGKKTILWLPDHGFIERKATKLVTIDLYIKFIFCYAYAHKDIGFIFRLHEAMFNEMISQGIWNDRDIQRIEQFCEQTDNIVWDRNDSYDMAFSMADGIMIDAFCGTTISALATMKPICVLYRNDLSIPVRNPELKEIADSYYSACNEKEIEDFIDLIIAGKDPMYDNRKRLFEKYIKTFDGRNGQRIKEFIERKYREKYN